MVDTILIDKIVFRTDRYGPSGEICIMNPDGSDLKRLTNHSSWDENPDWGKIRVDALTYAITPPDGNSEIFLINSDGSGKTQLTNQPERRPYDPAFSPDGTRIAHYTHVNHTLWSLWIMNSDGSNPIKLTDNPSEDWCPKFSPDGSKIAFQSKRDG